MLAAAKEALPTGPCGLVELEKLLQLKLFKLQCKSSPSSSKLLKLQFKQLPAGSQEARDLSDTSWGAHGPGPENPFDGTRDFSPVDQGHELELARRGDPLP